MDLIRDVLDSQLVDKKRRNIGRVDGIVLELRRGKPPRVAALEVGVVTLARRIHPRFARWFRMLALKISPMPLRTVRISPETVRDVGVDIEIDVDADADPRLLRFEKWLRRKIVCRIPGGAP